MSKLPQSRTSQSPRNEPPIVVTDVDLFRLQQCIAAADGSRQAGAAERLEMELARARVVPSASVPADVVTMNSRVLFEDVDTGVQRTVTLVYPRSANASEGRISVLAPVGAALLGLTVRQAIDWEMPSGRMAKIRLVEIQYQPEAAGDLLL